MNQTRLNSKRIQALSALFIASMISSVATGALISVSGSNSSRDVAPEIISNPAKVTNASETNEAQQGFDEVQNFLNTVSYTLDTGLLASNILVDSHMIFLNKKNGPKITHHDVVWTFSGSILGVMSDTNGSFEAASTADFGLAGTMYPASSLNARGLESNDGYSISDNQLTLTMRVSQPGDWIRIITASAVPDSTSSSLLLSIGLGWLFCFRRKACHA